jgi:tRNA threonylcarbamoyladenosine biosynthesis protein TsaE
MDRGRISYTQSAKETIDFGYSVGMQLAPGSIVCLFGDLGAGKTTLIKGIVAALSGSAPHDVCSPTFSYLNIYEGKCLVYHFDLYRLGGPEDFLSMGFEEYLFSHGISCLEWSERIASLLPKDIYQITLTHEGNEKRKIVYEVPKYSVC